MKHVPSWFAALVCVGAFGIAQEPERARNCVTCHGIEAKLASKSVHGRAGVDCITCHGGSPNEIDVAQAHAGMKVLSDSRDAVASCGECHSDLERMRSFGLRTDQLSLYATSRHGQKLAEDGEANVATCVTCHGSHDVIHVNDPRSRVHARNQIATCGQCHGDAKLMDQYGLPSDIVTKYRASEHGKALHDEGQSAAPSCSDCHGSHGALPPRTSDIGMVCGQCHSTVQNFYGSSPHTTEGGAQSTVQCIACHDNHGTTAASSDMFLGDDEGHCGSCHTDQNDPARAVAVRLHEDIQRFVATIRAADGAISTAAVRGLFLGEERGYLEEARGLLVRARTMTHTLSPEALDDVLNRGQAMVQTTMESLDTKHRIFRDRKIFTGIFFVVAIAFAIALAMHGRDIGGRWKKKSSRRALGEPHA